MAHDVFISYSNQDKTEANAVCATLESRGIRCWIAPRDITPGTSWPAAIVEAIGSSKVFVLVFSDRSNQSKQVAKEVGEAFDNEIPIVPLRLDDVKPSKEMRYYMRSTHWLDAMTPPLERHLDELVDTVTSFLSVEVKEQLTPAEPVYAASKKRRLPIPTWTIVLIAAAAVLVVGGTGFWAFSRTSSVSSSTIPTEVSFFTEDASPESVPEDQQPEETSFTEWSDWRPLSFNIPSETLWRQMDLSYRSIAQPSQDTITWSDEIIEGDFILSAEVSHDSPDGEAGFIIYGDGIGFSYGNLIFSYGGGFSIITKHTIYHEGENWLMVNEGDFKFQGSTRVFTIEIIGEEANFYVDNQKVAFVFLPSEINRNGRIGFYQHWEVPIGVTYSNIRIKTLADNE